MVMMYFYKPELTDKFEIKTYLFRLSAQFNILIL